MNWKRIISKLICKKPGVLISIIFQLCVMAGLFAFFYVASYGSIIKNKTFQTFITIYTFICVLLCYIQFTTSISPRNSRDLEALVVLVLFQVELVLPINYIYI